MPNKGISEPNGPKNLTLPLAGIPGRPVPGVPHPGRGIAARARVYHEHHQKSCWQVFCRSHTIETMHEKSLTTLEYPKILEQLTREAGFSASKELARTLAPSDDRNEVRRRLAFTSEARLLLEQRPNTGVRGAKEVRPHVRAAQALGASRARILRRHVLPFVQQPVLVRATQDIGYAVVAVASLSFIGVGAQPPTPEWGLILAGARVSVTSSWSYVVFPGLVIMLATTGFALLGDGLGGGIRRRPAGKAVRR